MKSPNSRLEILKVIGFGLFFLLISKLIYLQVYHHEYYSNRLTEQLKRIINLNPNRGIIYDRDKKPLALMKTSYSAYAIPTQIKDADRFISEVRPYFSLSGEELKKRIENPIHFVWLQRKLENETYLQLKARNIEGLNFIKEDKRAYPQGPLASTVLGFVGIDNQGLGGVEYRFDHLLKGAQGKIILEADPHGNRIVSGRAIKENKDDGKYILTTLDERIQYVTQKYLREGVLFQEAIGGQAIVLNCITGDILAMADYPSFDPNHWEKVSVSQRRNRCVTDVYEPGSTFKLFTLMSVLEEQIVTPGTMLDVPETLSFYGREIKEAHKRIKGDPDVYSVTDIISKSLNVGTTLLATKLGKEKFYRYLRQFGFGAKVGIDLPGESKGLLRQLNAWSGVDIGMISFGQGIAVTPLQLVTALTPIANEGVLIQPRIIKEITDSREFIMRATSRQPKKQVISQQTAEDVKLIMKKVVDEGTGKVAKISGYGMMAKTGTAQKARKDGLGYEKEAYIASFLGMFPYPNPTYMILVIVDTPKKKIWGSSVAGPIVKKIAEDIIDYKHIPPNLKEG